MAVSFNKVYPRPPVPLTLKTLEKFPFYFDSRRNFFEKSREEGAFEDGSVTMLMAPRIFGKTSFLSMLPKFLAEKEDERAVNSYSCMDPKQLDQVRVTVGEMQEGKKNVVLILDEMNYAVEIKPLWKKITKLAAHILSMKGRQTIILTTSETSSHNIKKAFDVLHPGILRLPALDREQTKNVASGVLKAVTGKRTVPSKLLDLIWSVSGGIPPYIRISILRVLRKYRKGVIDPQLSKACMFDFFDNLDAVKSCILTLTNCPIETSKMSDRDISLMADQFCLSCPTKCRTPSIKNPVVETDLAQSYGLVFGSNAIASPIAFYYNDYLGRKRFDEFCSDIAKKGQIIRNYVDSYGNKELTNDILILLEIAAWDPSKLSDLDGDSLIRFLRDREDLVFLERLPSRDTLGSWIRDFDSVCRATVHGDKGIDLEVRNLRLSTEIPAINSYVQCKNWKSEIDLKQVGIFHKFEMVLRTARQIHAAILVSTSKIDKAMIKEAESLTSERRCVFSCWGETELAVIVSAVCGRNGKVRAAIRNLSSAELPTKAKGGALEYLTLKTFSILAEKVVQP